MQSNTILQFQARAGRYLLKDAPTYLQTIALRTLPRGFMDSFALREKLRDLGVEHSRTQFYALLGALVELGLADSEDLPVDLGYGAKAVRRHYRRNSRGDKALQRIRECMTILLAEPAPRDKREMTGAI